MSAQILHKYIDFEQLGGYPFTQDDLQFLQDAWGEAIAALITAGTAPSGPMRVTGMKVTVAGGDITVSNGYFYYNGRLVKFTGATVTPTGGDVALVTITEGATSPEPFFDESTPLVEKSLTATISAAPTATDGTHFPLSSLLEFGRENWGTITVEEESIGLVSGQILYKRNLRNGTLLLNGTLQATNASDFADYGAEEYYEMATLPADAYKPATTQYFTVQVVTPNVSNSIGDVIYFHRQLNGKVDTDGKIWIEWLPIPGSGGLDEGTYDVAFNVIVTLD